MNELLCIRVDTLVHFVQIIVFLGIWGTLTVGLTLFAMSFLPRRCV